MLSAFRTFDSKTALILASVLVAVAIFNLVIVSQISSGIESKKETSTLASAEISRPANISVVTLSAADCSDCYDISTLVSAIKTAPVNVVSEKSLDYKSGEAAQLIRKYNIKKIPALIITGEVDKSNVKSALASLGDSVDGAIVFTKAPPVYINLSDDREVGRVTPTIIFAGSCTQCRNVSQIVEFFKARGATVLPGENYDYNSAEGKLLLSKYNITRAPAILFSKDLGAYSNIQEVAGWEPGIGTVEPDGTYIVRTALLPNIDVSTNKINGLVSLTNIVDKSCTSCYNVSLHKFELLNFGITPSGETTYDAGSPEGKALIAKYNITEVPTIVLSVEAGEYPQFADVWKAVGIVGKDGSYIFTAVSRMGAYKDLLSNKTVSKSSAQ